MPEVLRDLVVTLSLQSDNFSRNINSINRQIREAESSFRLAGAGIDNFGNTTAGMTSRLSMLQTNLGHQRDVVSQYERALASANSRLQESHARYQQYSQRLTEARQRHTELADSIRTHENELRVLKDEGHENTIAYAEAEAQLEGLRQEYAASGDEVKKLEGQCTSLQRAMQRDADAVSRAQTELNNARATVRETEAEIRRLTQQLKVSRSAWTQAGSALTAFSTKLTAIGKSATALGRRMTVMITTPIVAMGKKIVQASLDFESSFAYVRKTVQATEEQYDQLAAASKRLSTQIATSTTDINHVMSTGGQLGIATEHIEEFSRVMIDLANSSTDLDADTAATSLAKFANIMGTDQSLFRNIGSTVAELGNNFATTEEPIVTMAMRIAGAGKQIGLTEPQVLGLAAALSSVGIQAQAGGSSMSKALINMEVAAKTGGDALKDFAMVSGLTEKEFVEQWENDPVQVFQKFIEGLGKMDDEGASAVKTLNDIGISEIRLRDTLLRATNASELFSNAQKMATQAWKDNTALETMASKRYATLQSRLTNLKNRAVLFAQTLGDDLRPTIERVMESVGKFIDRLQNMDQGQRLQIARFAALAAAAGPVILIFGRLATGLGKLTGWLGTFCTAVGKAGGGMSGLLTVLAKSPAVWLAVGAAVVYGVAKLWDWVSGAKMAREATQALIDTANEWKNTAADTFYGRSGAGLSFFGMSEDDFKNDDIAKSARAWMTGLIDVWTDGKGETNEIVREWTDSWKALTESTRTELQALQGAAKDAGYTGVSEQIQADIDSLDSMDREIESLLKKRQNGFLTNDEKIRLQELIDNREAIIVKYKLQPDSETEGFQTILDKVEAEVARAQARGQQDADVSVYQNAMVAAAQGLAAINSEIDAQYDSEYALIQLMEDGGEKQAALTDLNTSYNERRLAATREYAQTLAQLVNPVWNDEGMQQTGDTLADLAGKLTAYDAAVKTYGEDSYQAAQALDAVKNAATGLDEGSLTEYAGVLTQISELLTSGMSMEEVQALFPEIDVSTALEQLASIQQFTSQYSSSLEGLASMFGEGLSEEVLKIATELDMTGAQANWDEFAANPGAITTDAIIAGIQEQENAARQQIKVDAVIERFTEKPEGADKTSLTPEGIIAYVETYAEATTGADVSGLTPENVTAMVSAYKELAEGADMSTLKPDEIVAYVNQYLEKEGVDTSGLTPEAVTAFVLAYQEIDGGALTTALTPDDVTAMVVKYLEAEGVDVSALTPDQVEALVNKFSEATGCDKSALAQSLTGYISSYDDSGATVPTPTSKLSISGYDLTALNQVLARNPIKVDGILRLGEKYDNPTDVLDDENAHFYYNGEEIPVNVVPAEKLTAETIIAYDADGTLHVVITPEVGTQEAVEETKVVYEDKPLKDTSFSWLTTSVHDSVTEINNAAAALEEYRQKVEEFKEAGTDTSMNGMDQVLRNQQGDLVQMIDDLSYREDDMQALANYALNLWQALNSGDLDATTAQEYATQLQEILDLVSAADHYLGVGNDVSSAIAQGMQEYGWEGDASTLATSLQTAIAGVMPQVGNDASAGVGQGAAAYDFSGDTATAAGNLEGAYRGSLQSQSPAQRMVPLGNDVSAGVGQGMTQYSFAGDSATAASNLMGALSSALAAQASSAAASARSIGTAITSGIASGIRSGQSAVIQAAVQAARSALSAAKAALAIHSPSAIFRDEVGLMAMKGMGEGFLEGQQEQAKIIRNAARFLTEEAQGGIIAGNTHNDNRQTWQQQSNVNLTGNSFYIRSDRDIHDLAVEIATLTRTQQRGRGLRMA